MDARDTGRGTVIVWIRREYVGRWTLWPYFLSLVPLIHSLYWHTGCLEVFKCDPMSGKFAVPLSKMRVFHPYAWFFHPLRLFKCHLVQKDFVTSCLVILFCFGTCCSLPLDMFIFSHQDISSWLQGLRHFSSELCCHYPEKGLVHGICSLLVVGRLRKGPKM